MSGNQEFRPICNSPGNRINSGTMCLNRIAKNLAESQEETMKKNLIVAASALVLSIAVIAPIRMQSKASPSPALAQQFPGPRPGRREPHPEIRRALRALQNAKTSLQSGARDFSGHRARAVQLVDQAIQECHAALQSDTQ